jgi:hypothetical protein
MDQIDLYLVDPASLARHHFIGALIFAAIAILSLTLMARFGWRSWPAIVIAAFVVPTIMVFLVGGARPGPNWPLPEFVVDVAAPLALLGLVPAAIGTLLGAAIRRMTTRNTA